MTSSLRKADFTTNAPGRRAKAFKDPLTFTKSKSSLYNFTRIRRKQKLICDDVLDMIGFTPIVRINNITKKEGVK